MNLSDKTIPFPSILDELVNYGNDKSIEYKARRIRLLCIKNGKLKLAENIYRKYLYKYATDLELSVYFSLMANNNNK